MRKVSAFLSVGVLALIFSCNAEAQDPQKIQDRSSGQSQSAVAPRSFVSDSGVQPEQPQSLGEVARLARAKKAAEPKASRLLNDDNFAHSLFVAGGSAPAISLVGSDGSGAAASGSAGRLTLLDFWATWCGPCRHALPGLKQLVSAYAGQVEVVSISEDRDEKAWHSFVEQNQMDWAQKMDSDRSLAKQYGVTAFPTYILIDSTGKVVQQLVGDDPSTPLSDRIGPEIRNTLAGKS